MLLPLGVVVLLARAVVPLVAYTPTTGLHVAVPPAHAAACASDWDCGNLEDLSLPKIAVTLRLSCLFS